MEAAVDVLNTLAGNVTRNVSDTFSNMTLEKYIRIIVIIGAYALLRPYMLKLAGKVQTKEHEKEVDESEMAAAAAISPNSLRGQVQVPDDSDDEVEATGADWGKKARRRQRQMVRRVLEADEKLRREQEEDEEDKDIQEFLVD